MTSKASKRPESGAVLHERIKVWQQFATKLKKVLRRLKEDQCLQEGRNVSTSRKQSVSFL